MKILIVLFLAAAFVVRNADPVEEYLSELKTIHEDCLKSSQCDKAIIKQHIAKGGVDDPKLREYLLCASKKKGYRNEAEVYQQEAHKNALIKIVKDEAIVDAMMKKCVHEKDTPGESILLSSRCFAKEVYDFIATKRHEIYKKVVQECKTETGVSELAVTRAAEGIEEPTDPKIKFHSLCVLKKLHGMDENGELNMNVIKTSLFMTFKNSDKVNEVAEKCCKKMSSPEETTYHYAICRAKHTKIFTG